MTPEQERAEAREALEKATQGKWEVNDFDTMYSAEIISEHPKGVFNGIASGMYVPDAQLIANASTWLRNSLDREEQLQEAYDDAEMRVADAIAERNDLQVKAAEQDKEIQSWKDRADRAETILEKIMHGDQS